MATARIEEILPEPPPKKVILELTWDEARVIRHLVGRVGGTGERRKEVNAIYNALDFMGWVRLENDFTGRIDAK